VSPAEAFRSILLHESIIAPTEAVLRQAGGLFRRHEGIVYWAGCRLDVNTYIVTTCIAPAARSGPGFFLTSAVSNAAVIAELSRNHLELLAQVHSHPGAYADHSDGDTRGALMPYEGFVSVVVPDYARSAILPLRRCGVHCFEGGTFRRLSREESRPNFPCGAFARGHAPKMSLP
jgi:proteasome lid subunit RPN8/RPN11